MAASDTSMFVGVLEAPEDPILGIRDRYMKDKSSDKVDLGVGAYRDLNGKPVVLRCVREAEIALCSDISLNKEYLPVDGLHEIKKPSQSLIFGEDCELIKANRIASVQSLSGTGALRVFAEFAKTNLPNLKDVYISDPSWPIHQTLFKLTGFNVKSYPYWDKEAGSIRYDDLISALKSASSNSAIIFHSSAHNPTGLDLSKIQWRGVIDIIKSKGILPVMDTAYQGFASGYFDEDSWSIGEFVKADIEIVVCQSFSKNLGLYGERTGMLHVTCASSSIADKVLCQLKNTIRPMYSSPPSHGVRIVNYVLRNKMELWKEEVKEIAGRIKQCRHDLRNGLEKCGTPGKWDHITAQIGMFSYTKLTPSQCDHLTDKWHIYLLKSGRISLAGLNPSNMEYVIKAIDETVRSGV